MPSVTLDAIELAQMLSLISRWLARDRVHTWPQIGELLNAAADTAARRCRYKP